MKTLIAIPCMDMVHTEFCRTLLAMSRVGDVQITFCQSSLIYDARNKLASIAIEGGFDRVLWLDSDMSIPSDLFESLAAHLDEGKEIVSGLYFGRRPPYPPIIFKSLFLSKENGHAKANAVNFEDYPKDKLFQIAGCGFGAVMMTTEALRRISDACGLPFFPVSGFGEDLAFCLRATEVGISMWCDPRVRLGHVGAAVFNEECFLAAKGAGA